MVYIFSVSVAVEGLGENDYKPKQNKAIGKEKGEKGKGKKKRNEKGGKGRKYEKRIKRSFLAHTGK